VAPTWFLRHSKNSKTIDHRFPHANQSIEYNRRSIICDFYFYWTGAAVNQPIIFILLDEKGSKTNNQKWASLITNRGMDFIYYRPQMESID
jgi:hypothetical protein